MDETSTTFPRHPLDNETPAQHSQRAAAWRATIVRPTDADLTAEHQYLMEREAAWVAEHPPRRRTTGGVAEFGWDDEPVPGDRMDYAAEVEARRYY